MKKQISYYPLDNGNFFNTSAKRRQPALFTSIESFKSNISNSIEEILGDILSGFRMKCSLNVIVDTKIALKIKRQKPEIKL